LSKLKYTMALFMHNLDYVNLNCLSPVGLYLLTSVGVFFPWDSFEKNGFEYSATEVFEYSNNIRNRRGRNRFFNKKIRFFFDLNRFFLN